MTHSLRSLFHIMLAVWLVLVLLMAIILKVHLPAETSGALVENLFTRPVPPPPAPVLQTEAPRTIIPPKPAPLPPSPWRKLEQGHRGSTGNLGIPEIIEQGDTVEIVFPFQGAPGEITFYRLPEKGSLSVDLQGDIRLQQPVEHVMTEGFVRRLQAYPHPGYTRISARGRTRDLLKRMNAAAYVSEDRLRIVFTLDKEPSVTNLAPQNTAQEKNNAPAAPL